MSISSTYVRARDGALYKNPIVVFPEGFICFDERDGAEVVFWVGPGKVEAETCFEINVVGVLNRILKGDGYYPNLIHLHHRSERVRPGSDPWIFCPAISYKILLRRRIPRPMIHDGTERYAGRIDGFLMDLPRSAMDAVQIETPD